MAVERTAGPTALALSRQKLTILAETAERAAAGVPRGGYVLYESAGGPAELLLIATGSEVELALAGLKLLEREGRRGRLVSMPSWELFAAQPESYRAAVLPPGIAARLAVEAASPLGWERFVGLDGAVLGMDGFGASAPAEELARHFGFTPERVASLARESMRPLGRPRGLSPAKSPLLCYPSPVRSEQGGRFPGPLRPARKIRTAGNPKQHQSSATDSGGNQDHA